MKPWESYYASDQPLFRVGSVPVYVTTIVVALNAIVMVFFAILGPSSSAIASALIFSKGAILQDWKLWTLVTYAFVDSINFFQRSAWYSFTCSGFESNSVWAPIVISNC